MNIVKAKYRLIGGAVGVLLWMSASASANPVSLEPPALVDGKMPVYSRVKKNGQIWYPANVVGLQRGIKFAYDPANKTLFANGMPTKISSLVIDNVVYVNIRPRVVHGELSRDDALVARYDAWKAKNGSSPHANPEERALFVNSGPTAHPHPWTVPPTGAEAGSASEGPLINLEPTSEPNHVPAHMRPGARPPDHAPEILPNRLPPRGSSVVARQNPDVAASSASGTIQVTSTGGPPGVQTVQIGPSGVAVSPLASTGIPARVTTSGGPTGTQIPEPGQLDTSGLQPIPQAPAVVVESKPFSNSGSLHAASETNSVFRVSLDKGLWTKSERDGILKIKISQENLSAVAQSNLGHFTVVCTDGSRIEASKTRSYLPDGTLDPGSRRDGDLVFRLASGKVPKSLDLEGALKLSIPLKRL